MSTPKLVFSFASGMNLEMDKNALANGPVIKFGRGFDNLEMVSNNLAFTAVSPQVLTEEKPSVQFNLKSEQQFPTLKRKLVEPVYSTAVAVKGVERAPQKLKTAIVANEEIQDGQYCLPVASVFEVGSSSKAPYLTRSQRRNRNRKVRKMLQRQEDELEFAEMEAVRQSFELPETSPLLGGSRFHPLSAAGGEESVRRIAASPPRPFKYDSAEKKEKKSPFALVRGVFERLARKDNCSVATILNRMGCAVSPKVKELILRKDRGDRPHVGPEFKRIRPRDTQRDLRNKLNDLYRETGRYAAVRKDYKDYLKVKRPLKELTRPHLKHEVRYVAPKLPSLFRARNSLSSKDDKRTDLVIQPHPGHRAPPSHDATAKFPSRQASCERREWIPKAATPPKEGKETDKSTVPDSPKWKPVEETTEETEQYVPVDAYKIRGRPMDEVLEELRQEIEKIKEKQAISEQEFDDDIVNEDYASINVIETRASSALHGQQQEEEEDNQTEASEHFQQQIREKDEQIERLEKKMGEILLLLASLQNQPQASQTRPTEVTQPEVIQINDTHKSATVTEDTSPAKKVSDVVEVKEKDLKQMVQQQVKEALAQSKSQTILKGRPYPEEFDAVQYPKGFVPPAFKVFDGTGNPRQHMAHFRASCCNAGGSDALLFRQFVSSLAGTAFDWYAELPNGSLQTFAELEDLFVKRFAGAQHHVTVGDLVVEQQRPDETLVDYILRWRNLSMKCEPQLQEQHAIGILLKSIHGPIAFMLKGFTIKTFEKLLSKAASLQEEAKQLTFLEKADENKRPKFQKVFEKKTATVSAVDKGKQPMKIQFEPPARLPQQNPRPFPPQQHQQQLQPVQQPAQFQSYLQQRPPQ